jgi:PPOX class probable F420-dependent enzyme
MPEEMTTEARRAFLKFGTRTATLATTRADGRPHAVPICFVLDDDDLLFVTNETTAKGWDMRRDARVALVVDDDNPPFAFVAIEGRAELTRAAHQIEPVARRIAQRYGDAADADDFVRFAQQDLGTLVRVRPDKIIALDRVGEH